MGDGLILVLAGEDAFAIEDNVEGAGRPGTYRNLDAELLLQARFEAHGLSFDAGSKEAALNLEAYGVGAHNRSISAHCDWPQVVMMECKETQ